MGAVGSDWPPETPARVDDKVRKVFSTINGATGSRGQASTDEGNPMRTLFTVACFSLAAVVLGACDESPPVASMPHAMPVQAASSSATGDARDPSVPPVDSVITPPSQTQTDPQAGRTNRSMSRAQESTAMPMPGQNNDHSAPLTPAKRASGP
jgi:hypothetical protein